jgi:hypothetical protein
MNQKHYSTILIFVLLFISFESAYAQNGLQGRNNIKASHSTISYWSFDRIHFFQLEYNRGITKFIEAGSYLNTHRDFYPVRIVVPDLENPIIVEQTTRALHYGLQTNIHPLQLFISEGHRFRLDFYIIAKIGGLYSPVYDDSLRSQEHFFEYNFGLGLAYHFFDHIGIFGEYNYLTPANFKYGLSIKF